LKSKEKVIDEKLIKILITWRHVSGFCVHNTELHGCLQAHDDTQEVQAGLKVPESSRSPCPPQPLPADKNVYLIVTLCRPPLISP
jgi:hypothetical protein